MQYMILLDDSDRPPRHIHYDFESAKEEAMRLSDKFSSPATILAIVGRVEKRPVYELKTIINEQGQAIIDAEEDELPF